MALIVYLLVILKFNLLLFNQLDKEQEPLNLIIDEQSQHIIDEQSQKTIEQSQHIINQQTQHIIDDTDDEDLDSLDSDSIYNSSEDEGDVDSTINIANEVELTTNEIKDDTSATDNQLSNNNEQEAIRAFARWPAPALNGWIQCNYLRPLRIQCLGVLDIIPLKDYIILPVRRIFVQIRNSRNFPIYTCGELMACKDLLDKKLYSRMFWVGDDNYINVMISNHNTEKEAVLKSHVLLAKLIIANTFQSNQRAICEAQNKVGYCIPKGKIDFLN